MLIEQTKSNLSMHISGLQWLVLEVFRIMDPMRRVEFGVSLQFGCISVALNSSDTFSEPME